MRFLLFLAVATALAWPVRAEKNDLLKMLPDEKVFMGWRARPDSLFYGRGGRLSDIYSGSAEYYKRKGVVEALQLCYERGRDMLVVTINAFDGKEKARAMFESWKSQAERRKVFRPVQVRDGAGITPELGGAVGFMLTGNHLIKTQVVSNGNDVSNELGRVLIMFSRSAGNASPAGTERR